LLRPEAVIAYMRERGCLHHQLLDLEGEWWLVEEWESPERFEAFFDRTPEFRRALREAGFKEFPDDVRLWRSLESVVELDSATAESNGDAVNAT
jgi:quinol monooxygenase YgiN